METNSETQSEGVGRLAAGIVHELNSPLGALRSATDTLARLLERLRIESGGDRSIAAMAGPVSVIESGAERIAEVVAVLERLERSINHRDEERVVVDLRTCLDRVLGRRAGALESVRTECHFDGRPSPVRCNRVRLEGTLADLLEHAAGSLPNGGEITLCMERVGSHAEMWIADNGPGMSEQEVSSACALGFAARDGRVRLHLGLAACKQAIEAEGGDLHIESTPGAGTQLRVRLPIASDA